MSDYTPRTDEMRQFATRWADCSPAAFDRWLESVRAEERERIARNIEERARRVAPAIQTSPGGDYWTGLIRAARIVREGA